MRRYSSSRSRTRTPSRERSRLAPRTVWNLEELYPDAKSWEESRLRIASQMPEIERYRGTLHRVEDLCSCLALQSEIQKALSRLVGYAHMKSDEDTRNAESLARKQQMDQMITEWQTLSAFLEPELLGLDPNSLIGMMDSNPGLAPYRMMLGDILRRKLHTLSEKEEKILAETGRMAGSPHDVFSVFINADLPYPTISLHDGQRVRLDQAGYAKYRSVSHRGDREKVFKTFFHAIDSFRRTFGTQLNAHVQKNLFYSRVRGYSSVLEWALDADNIPPAVYHSLIKKVNEALPLFQRYLELRRRLLKVDRMAYFDMYAPVVRGLNLDCDYDTAADWVLKALSPLGTEYVSWVEKAFKDRWIDVYPTPGKRSGAYSNGGAYDVHPYILLNFTGRAHDVSTLAHELGHAMHSTLSNKTQPFPMAGYSIFVAEVASTFNEVLLAQALLDKEENEQRRLSLLMDILDGMKGTLFRQTQFAEFELRTHEMAERQEAITGDVLSGLYGEILKRYYGHGSRCRIDELYFAEWAQIPHFYYNFYVYQYATSYTASSALASKVLAGDKDALARYLRFLSSGGSAYPIDLLKEAGVDMISGEPFACMIKRLENVMDDVEGLLEKRERKGKRSGHHKSHASKP